MKKKINIGIIGKNFGLRVILKAFKKNKKLKIVALSSIKKPKKNLLEENSLYYFPNWKKMINSKLIDAVVVATPPNIQDQIVNYSIKKNKHIFCEKPFTESFQKAKKIVNIIKNKKKLANIVNFIFPEIETWKVLKKQLQKKQNIEKVELHWRMNSKLKTNNWKSKHSQGGGVLYNWACHSFYYLENLFGKIISYNCKVYKKKKDFPYRLISTLYFLSGAVAKVDINLLSKDKSKHQLKIKTNKKLFNLMSNINTIYSGFDLTTKNSKNKIFRIKLAEKKSKNDFRIEPTYKNSIKFSKWILSGVTQKPNFQDALRVHEIINDIAKQNKI